MKWSQFVVQEGEAVKPNSPISHLHVSRSNSSLSNQKRFTLKSLQKSALNLSKNIAKKPYLKEEENSADPALKKMMSKISFMSNNFSRVRDENSFYRKSAKSINKEMQILGQLYEAFIKEFQTFIEFFFNKFSDTKLKVMHQQTLQDKILKGVQESITIFFKTNEKLIFREDSPVKKNAVYTQKSSQQSPTLEKKFSRALQFKNQKIIEKDLYNENQKKKGDLQNLISKIKKGEADVKRKFTRTGSRSKRDYSQNSSVEDIIERSFNDSHRSSRSKLQAREAIYKFNKIFNQDNPL